MKVNPSIRELRKSLCWVPSSLTSSKKQSVYWCFDFLCTQRDLSDAYHWGTAPFTQVKVFCLLSSGVPYHWPAAFSNEFAFFAYLLKLIMLVLPLSRTFPTQVALRYMKRSKHAYVNTLVGLPLKLPETDSCRKLFIRAHKPKAYRQGWQERKYIQKKESAIEAI